MSDCLDSAEPQGVEVVNMSIGSDWGQQLSDWDYGEKYLKVIPFPGAVRWPSITYWRPGLILTLLKLYQHFLFGLALDLLARLGGVKPRQAERH